MSKFLPSRTGRFARKFPPPFAIATYTDPEPDSDTTDRRRKKEG